MTTAVRTNVRRLIALGLAVLAVALLAYGILSSSQSETEVANWTQPAGFSSESVRAGGPSVTGQWDQTVATELTGSTQPAASGVLLEIGNPVAARLVVERGQLVSYSAAAPSELPFRTEVGAWPAGKQVKVSVRLATSGAITILLGTTSVTTSPPTLPIESDLRSVVATGSAWSKSTQLAVSWSGSPPTPNLVPVYLLSALAAVGALAVWAGSSRVARGAFRWRPSESNPWVSIGIAVVLIGAGCASGALLVSDEHTSNTQFRSVSRSVSRIVGNSSGGTGTARALAPVLFDGKAQTYPSVDLFRAGALTYVSPVRHDLDAVIRFKVPAGNDQITLLDFGGQRIVAFNQLLSYKPQVVNVTRNLRLANLKAGTEHTIQLRIVDNQVWEVFVDGTIATNYRLNAPDLTVDQRPLLEVNPEYVDSVEYTINERGNTSMNNPVTAIDAWGRGLSLILCLLGALLAVLAVLTLLATSVIPPPQATVAMRIALWIVGIGAAVTVILLVFQAQVPTPNSPIDAARNWPLFSPGSRFSDFYETEQLAQSGDPYTLASSWYPPFGQMLVWPMSLLGSRASLQVFEGLGIGMMAAMLWWSWARAAGRMRLIGLAVAGLSFPMWFAIDRANVELITAGFALLAIALAVYGASRVIPGILLGLAVAAKLWPLFLITPLLRRGGALRVTIAFVIAGVAATLASAALMEAGVLGSLQDWLAVVAQGPLRDGKIDCGSAGLVGIYGTSLPTLALAGVITSTCATRGQELSAFDESLLSAVYTYSTISAAVAMLITCALVWLLKAPKALAFSTIATGLLLWPLPSLAYRAVILFTIIVVLPVMAVKRPKLLGVALGLALALQGFWYFGWSAGSNINTASFTLPLACCFLFLVLVVEVIGQWRDRRREAGMDGSGGSEVGGGSDRDAAPNVDRVGSGVS